MNKNNCFCFTDNPIDNKQLYRLNFIISQDNNSIEDFNINFINSLYATNIKFLKCTYPKEIIDNYKNKKKMYDKINT